MHVAVSYITWVTKKISKVSFALMGGLIVPYIFKDAQIEYGVLLQDIADKL